jgi:hypothetical protein
MKSKQAANKEDKKKPVSPKEEKKGDTPNKDSAVNKQAEKVEVKNPEKVEVKQESTKPQPADAKERIVNLSNIEYYKSMVSKLNTDWQIISSERQIKYDK